VNWLCHGLSADGETLAAGVRGQGAGGGRGGTHEVHLWCRHTGALLGVLEGPPDAGPAVALTWHPTHSGLLVSLGGESGCVYLWARAGEENWSAFAPDFRELSENEEYVEREDEFDVPIDCAAQEACGASVAQPLPLPPPFVDIFTPWPLPAEVGAPSDGRFLRSLPLCPLPDEHFRACGAESKEVE
jgi:hypothetical protein